MDVVRTLIGVHGFKVLRMAHHVIANLNTIAAVHVPRLKGDVKGLDTVVSKEAGRHADRNRAWPSGQPAVGTFV